jgi:putative SOS response-associated peptidase YedK
MCNRFTQKTDPREFTERLRLTEIRADLSDQRDRYPLLDVAIARLNEQGGRELVACQWGLLPRWWKPSEKSKSRKSFQRMTFNARSETVDTKPSYRDAFRRRRCLIPASQFYEHGYYFNLPHAPLFAFAGLWETWQGDGEMIESCTILTTEANPLVAEVHPKKRMPVILDGETAFAEWLNPSVATRGPLEKLFAAYDAGLMKRRRVDE